MNASLAVVMAAGKGTRMKSDLPKVLVPVLGRPMLLYVLDSLRAAGVARQIVVVGYRADDVKETLQGQSDVQFVLQAEQRGTGHAVACARELLQGHDGPVVVVAGDSPMLETSSVARLLDEHQATHPACLLGTAEKADPTGLGRIVRDGQGRFEAIVEEKDATQAQQRIREVNLSTYVFHGTDLLWALEQLRSDNAQAEYYLTDCPGILLRAGKDVRALCVLQPHEALSINDPDQLIVVEKAMRELSSSRLVH